MADREKFPQSGSDVVEARPFSMTSRLRSSRSLSPDANSNGGGERGSLSPDLIFFGYSHDSEPWLKQVLLPFQPAEHLQLIEIFSDQDLVTGDDWHLRIQANIRRAKIAILLIDSHFLTSRYCLENEVRPLLERHAKGELQIIPILVEPCHWKLFAWLRRLQLRTFDKLALSELPPNRIQTHLAAFAWEVLQSLGVTPPEHPDPDPDQPSPGSPAAILIDHSGSITRTLDGRQRFGRPRDLKASWLSFGLEYYRLLCLPWELLWHDLSQRHLRFVYDDFTKFGMPGEALIHNTMAWEAREQLTVRFLEGPKSGRSTLVGVQEQAPPLNKARNLPDGIVDQIYKCDFNAIVEQHSKLFDGALEREADTFADATLWNWITLPDDTISERLSIRLVGHSKSGKSAFVNAPLVSMLSKARPLPHGTVDQGIHFVFRAPHELHSWVSDCAATENNIFVPNDQWWKTEPRIDRPILLEPWGDVTSFNALALHQAWSEIIQIQLARISDNLILRCPSEPLRIDAWLPRNYSGDDKILLFHAPALLSLGTSSDGYDFYNLHALDRISEISKRGTPFIFSAAKLDFRRVLRDLLASGSTIFFDDPKVDYAFKRELWKVTRFDNDAGTEADFQEDGWSSSYIPVDLTDTCGSTGQVPPF